MPAAYARPSRLVTPVRAPNDTSTRRYTADVSRRRTGLARTCGRTGSRGSREQVGDGRGEEGCEGICGEGAVACRRVVLDAQQRRDAKRGDLVGDRFEVGGAEDFGAVAAD